MATKNGTVDAEKLADFTTKMLKKVASRRKMRE
jgi:hypothetical protein